MIRPPRLRSGARVLLVAAAGPVTFDRIEVALDRCRAFGLEPVVAPSASRQHGYLAGTDEERAADLQAGIDDDSIDAIWALRGGYGTMRLVNRLDFRALRTKPKPFIGFSDNTVLHQALARSEFISFHGPHAGTSAFPPATQECFQRVLFRAEPAGALPLPPEQQPPVALTLGSAEGALTGGNLSLLAASCGTRYAVRGRGKIVLIEEVGEAVYRIDRMLTQLSLAGVLEGAAGIAFGAFTELVATAYDRPLEEMLWEWVEPLGIPAVMGLPFGHGDENWTIPLGVRARLDASSATLELLEPAVS